MDHIAALLIAIACPADLGSCAALPVHGAAFETVEECAIVAELAADEFGPGNNVLYARCIALDAAEPPQPYILAWNIDRQGELVAEARPVTQPLPSGPRVLVASRD